MGIAFKVDITRIKYFEQISLCNNIGRLLWSKYWREYLHIICTTIYLLLPNLLFAQNICFVLCFNLNSTRKIYTMLQNLTDKSKIKCKISSDIHVQFFKASNFPLFQVSQAQESGEKSYFLCKWIAMFIMVFLTFDSIILTFGASLWEIYTGNYQSGFQIGFYRFSNNPTVMFAYSPTTYRWFC